MFSKTRDIGPGFFINNYGKGLFRLTIPAWTVLVLLIIFRIWIWGKRLIIAFKFWCSLSKTEPYYFIKETTKAKKIPISIADRDFSCYFNTINFLHSVKNCRHR